MSKPKILSEESIALERQRTEAYHARLRKQGVTLPDPVAERTHPLTKNKRSEGFRHIPDDDPPPGGSWIVLGPAPSSKKEM